MKKNDAKQIRVTFLQVSSAKVKQNLIITKAREYFEKKTPLLFRLSNRKTLDYLDLLLWRYPADSFLPHVIASDKMCNALIALTEEEEANPNRAHTVFNLSKKPVQNSDHFFTQIYEFEPPTSAQEHYHFYKERGYTIITT